MPKVKTLKNVTEKEALSQNNIKIQCINCRKEKNTTDFYKSNSVLYKNNYSRLIWCNDCIFEFYAKFLDEYNDCKIALYSLCRLLDVYFNEKIFDVAEQTSKTKKTGTLVGIYFQKINSLPQYANKTFKNSILLDCDYGNKSDSANSIITPAENIVANEEDIKNKNDVIRMVGYDPFENENPLDAKYLYNTLVDFLDESTLEDSFKLPIVIEIVKSFNQIDKINQSLALITSDITNIQSQASDVKVLVQTKKDIYNSVLGMAKDNGISVNYNNSKSKGAGTLTGIIKKLQELGFDEVEINLFDIETCNGLEQVANISNQSILKQLMFDENDYTEMIKEQVILIDKYKQKSETLEEENRLLKLKMTLEQVGDN